MSAHVDHPNEPVPAGDFTSEFEGWARGRIAKTNAEHLLILVTESGAIKRGVALCWKRNNGETAYLPIAPNDAEHKNSLSRIYWNEPTAALLTAFCIAKPLAHSEPGSTLIPVSEVGANDAKYERRLGAKLADLAEKKWYANICPRQPLSVDRGQKTIHVSGDVARGILFFRKSPEGFQELNAADLGTLRVDWMRRFEWLRPQRPNTEEQAQLPLASRLVHPPPTDQSDPAADGLLFGTRKKALQDLIAALGVGRRGTTRVLIEGAIGTGKTRVAYELYQAIVRPEWSGPPYDAVVWLTPRDLESYPSSEICLRHATHPDRCRALLGKLLNDFDWKELADKVGLAAPKKSADFAALAETLQREFPKRIFFIDNAASDLLAELPIFGGADVVITSPYVHVAHRSRTHNTHLIRFDLDPVGDAALADDELQGLYDPGQTTPLPAVDLAQLQEFSRRVQGNPLAIVDFGFRAKHVSGGVNSNLGRYADDSSFNTELGASDTNQQLRIRDTYAGRWGALVEAVERDLKRTEVEQLHVAAMFCPEAIPLEMIRAVMPGFANKAFLQELHHRRIAHVPEIAGKSYLALRPFVARTVRRRLYRAKGIPGLARPAQQAVSVLMHPLVADEPAEKVGDPADDRLINSHLAVLLRCFEVDLTSPVEDLGRLVRHCCYFLEQRREATMAICPWVCPNFPNDRLGIAKTLLARHAGFLARLEKSAVGTKPEARAWQRSLAWERARNLDEQAVAALATSDEMTTGFERLQEFRRARNYGDQAVEIVAAAVEKTGRPSWIALNLRRWCALTHTCGVSNQAALEQSTNDIKAVIAERHNDLRSENFRVITGRTFRWSTRLPQLSREQALHYLADDYLSLGLVARQSGEQEHALESLICAWRLARDVAVRKRYPISYTLTAGIALLVAQAQRDVATEGKRLAADGEVRKAARQLLLKHDDRWRFSRMVNLVDVSAALDQLGIL
jgi:hypothetical protein